MTEQGKLFEPRYPADKHAYRKPKAADFREQVQAVLEAFGPIDRGQEGVWEQKSFQECNSRDRVRVAAQS